MFQVNFFHDHTKVVICPLMQAVTYIDDKKVFRVYRMQLLERYGCGKDLASRLRYASTMVERLMNPRSGSSSTAGSHKQQQQQRPGSASVSAAAAAALAAAAPPSHAHQPPYRSTHS